MLIRTLFRTYYSSGDKKISRSRKICITKPTSWDYVRGEERGESGSVGKANGSEVYESQKSVGLEIINKMISLVGSLRIKKGKPGRH